VDRRNLNANTAMVILKNLAHIAEEQEILDASIVVAHVTSYVQIVMEQDIFVQKLYVLIATDQVKLNLINLIICL
jgi:hypothetical protein